MSRAAIIVCATSFVMGGLFTHWIADVLTLWKLPATAERLWTAAGYYSIICRGPIQILYAFASVAALGGITIILSLTDGEAGNIMFDGGSIFLFGTSIAMYTYSVLPNLASTFALLPAQSAEGSFPLALEKATMALASNNLMCSVALTGVLVLQCGKYWAQKADSDDDVQENAATAAGTRETSVAPA